MRLGLLGWLLVSSSYVPNARDTDSYASCSSANIASDSSVGGWIEK